MTDWNVRSLGVHADHVSAKVIAMDNGGNLIEMTWQGSATSNPELATILKQLNNCIRKQMPRLECQSTSTDVKSAETSTPR